ncbi:MAG TPA: HAMP domain-containing sensor histidine kinase [Acidimicrobiia bacterium]|nr:HAMP domain-containing sensor histidine kinase [Acidimicrobiia bacterium]
MTTTERRSVSARARILGWYVLLLAVALVAALLLQRALLLRQAAVDADQALDQEVSELRQLAGGTNPTTGEPFAGDVEAIFDVFLSRNVPLEGESFITLIDGRPYKTDLSGATLAQTDLVERWAVVTEPVREEVPLPGGDLRYLAVPLSLDGEVLGVFVAAIDMGVRLSALDDVVRLGALVYGSIFLVASILAWVAAGGVLRPLRQLRDTAGGISDSDLSRRIPVAGNDEIADLGRSFNAMLDRLEEAFETQRRFVDDAGHELRTPITVIRGHLELMGDDPDERADTVRLVTDELDRMARIVDDLLVLAKAEQPDFVEVHPMDLGALTDGLLSKAALLDDRPWSIDERADVVVVADEQRLTQAMMNLMRNAVEHTPPGTAVAIGSALRGDEAVLWVRDAGTGIAAADRERLFERFARGTRGRRATDGAGLGLAIVAAIADGHGGRVAVEDAEGGGALFTLHLPVGDRE